MTTTVTADRLLTALAAVAALTFSSCSSDAAKSSPNTDSKASASASSTSPATSSPDPVTAPPTVTPEPETPATQTAATSAATTVSLPASGDGGDPCRLLTAAEAEAVLGEPVGAGLPRSFDIPPTGVGIDCSYSTVDQTAGPTTVHVGILASDVPRDQWEQAERAEGGVEISGVGELAFFDKNNEEINAFDHGHWIQAQLINTDEATQLADLSQIVITAIGRI